MSRENLLEYAKTIFFALIISSFIILFIVQAFYIPSESMRPTLKKGDRILVNKFIYHFVEPDAQDIVVFKYPVHPGKKYIKRIIGLPGDTIFIDDGLVYINGELLKEDYILTQGYSDYGPIEVPEDNYFVLGDNRNNSEDSRFWGFVPRNYIVGKAMLIYWPLNRIKLLQDGEVQLVKTIQWFPGHMAKAMRVLKEHLKMVDIVLELLDARIPYSSSNPELDKLVEHKDRIIILNKKDLANPQVTTEWINYFAKKAPSFAVNTLNGSGFNEVLEAVNKKADGINQRLKQRGRNPRNIRLMIIGIPNVGKSALINRLANRSSAKVENRPGVTRGKQWIKVKEGLMLLDSPGILWPKFENQDVGFKLAATGAIRSEVLDEREVAYHLIKWLLDIAGEDLKTFFGVELVDDPYEMMLVLGKKRGLLMSGGRVREEQTAKMILKEYRDGRIGKISLERPSDMQ